MAKFFSGDLISFRLQGEIYGLAHVLTIENLALTDVYHLSVYDSLLDAEPGGVDDYVGPVDRLHEFSGIENARPLVDHLALTRDAFNASDPVRLGNLPVRDEELLGYQLWLQLQFERGVEAGMFRGSGGGSADAEEEDGEWEDEGEEIEGEEFDEVEEEIEDSGEPEPIGEIPPDGREADMESEQVEMIVHPWHSRLLDVPIGNALFEFQEEFATADLHSPGLGAFIARQYLEGNSEEIARLMQEFSDGDYAAGQELMRFGDKGAEALNNRLQNVGSPEVAGDILQILADMGSEKAYQYISSYFAVHGTDSDDPFAQAAARAYCYAVMLTGGSPKPLHDQLDRLDDILDPELAHDISMAREAVRAIAADGEGNETGPGENSSASSNPFHNLGI